MFGSCEVCGFLRSACTCGAYGGHGHGVPEDQEAKLRDRVDHLETELRKIAQPNTHGIKSLHDAVMVAIYALFL